MRPALVTFEYYVQAYWVPAQMMDVEVEELWRRLWSYPPGEIRAHYSEIVDLLRRERMRRELTPVQRARLSLAADRLFDSNRAGDVPDSTTLLETWRRFIFA